MIGNVMEVGAVLPPGVSTGSPVDTARECATDRGPWFTAAEYLTGRGYRQLPAAAQMALAATRRLPDAGDQSVAGAEGRGLWIGSSTAGAAVHDVLLDDSWDAGAEGIGPLSAPYFSVNLTGSRIAEERQTLAGSVMCTTPSVAGVDALAGALTALRTGQVDEALVCLVEAADGRAPAEAVASGAVTIRLGPGGPGERSLRVRRGYVPDVDAAALVLRDALAVSAEPGTPTVVALPLGVPETGFAALAADTVLVPTETGLPAWAALATAIETGTPVTLGVASRLGHWGVIDYRPDSADGGEEPARATQDVVPGTPPVAAAASRAPLVTVAVPAGEGGVAHGETGSTPTPSPTMSDLGWRGAASDEWALVLGASSGFGERTALRLAEVGYNVYGVYFGAAQQDEAAAEVERVVGARGLRCVMRNANAASSTTREEVRDELGSLGARVRTAVHSLAFGALLPFVAPIGRAATDTDTAPGLLSTRQMSSTMEVMAHSLVWWVRDLAAADLFSPNAQVWAMTSAGDSRVADSYGAVSAAKSALLSHVRQLAVELAPAGVAVNAIRAGVTMTPSFRKIPGSEALAEHTARVNPHGRLTRPEDVADLVALATLWDSTWVTGSVIGADGGEGLVT